MAFVHLSPSISQAPAGRHGPGGRREECRPCAQQPELAGWRPWPEPDEASRVASCGDTKDSPPQAAGEGGDLERGQGWAGGSIPAYGVETRGMCCGEKHAQVAEPRTARRGTGGAARVADGGDACPTQDP